MSFRKTASSLGEILVESGILTAEDLRRGLDEQRARGLRLGEALVSLGLLTRDDLCWALSRQYALAYVHPSDLAVDPSCAARFPESLARRHGAAPLFEAGGELHIVVEDPLSLEALAEAEELQGCRINASIGAAEEVRALLERLYGSGDAPAGAAPPPPAPSGPAVIGKLLPEAEAEAALRDGSGLALLTRILERATEGGARAVHLECVRGAGRVRLRCDGALADALVLRSDWHAVLVTQLERLAGCDGREIGDLAEGTIRLTLNGEGTRLSVALLETDGGRSAIVGLLPRELSAPPLPEIGLAGEDLERLRLLASRGFGLWIVTGHQWTSSGVVLHSLLRHLARSEHRVVSFREESEVFAKRPEFHGIERARHSTVPIDLDIAVRNDFDIVLVGRLFERPDIERALEASARGKTVLATMDFRSPRAVLQFLLSYGFNRGLLAAALAGILAQREIRLLCPHCRVIDDRAPRLEFPVRNERPRVLTAYRGAGCPRCAHTGVRRREILLEFWPADDALGRALVAEDPFARLDGLGRPSLREVGMEHVRRGETPLEDVAPLFEN